MLIQYASFANHTKVLTSYYHKIDTIRLSNNWKLDKHAFIPMKIDGWKYPEVLKICLVSKIDSEYLTKKTKFYFVSWWVTLRRFSQKSDYCIGLTSILLLDLEVYCKSFQNLEVTSNSSPENLGTERSINRLNGIDVSAQEKSRERLE